MTKQKIGWCGYCNEELFEGVKHKCPVMEGE